MPMRIKNLNGIVRVRANVGCLDMNSDSRQWEIFSNKTKLASRAYLAPSQLKQEERDRSYWLLQTSKTLEAAWRMRKQNKTNKQINEQTYECT